MSDPTCVRCTKPMPDQAYACTRCARNLAQALQEAAGHAEDAWTVIARQARYGGGGRGGSDEPLPVDLTASARLAPITLAICGWAQVVIEETGRCPRWRQLAGPLCPPAGMRCEHDSCQAIRRRTPPPDIARDAAWLAQQVQFLRRHPAATEAFAELHDTCHQLARLVDRPADKDLVGMCDCGRTLYALPGRTFVECPERTCRLTWHVERSREILRKALAEKLFTAAEAAHLAAHWDERSSEQIRRLISMWAHPKRRLIEARGEIDGAATYRFGDVIERLERTPRRAAREAAEMGA